MQTAFDAWVMNAIADIVDTQALYWRGPGHKLVLTLALTRMVDCQAFSLGRDQALARFSGLSADCGTVFH